VRQRLIVELDFKRMNFQKRNRPDMDDAAGYKQTNEQEQERTEA
jgi:hypothetical protein